MEQDFERLGDIFASKDENPTEAEAREAIAIGLRLTAQFLCDVHNIATALERIADKHGSAH